MRIALVTTAWGRPAIWAVVAGYYHRLKIASHDLTGYVAISPEDPSAGSLRYISSHNHFHVVEAPNRPLSEKWQVVLQLAREQNPDCVLITGSDDLVGEGFFRRATDAIAAGAEIVTQEDAHFYHIMQRRLIHVQMPQNGTRLLSKAAIDKMQWRLWEKHDKALAMDRSMDNRIGGKLVMYRLPPHKSSVILDLKGGGTTRVPFEKYERNLQSTLEDPMEFFASHFTREHYHIWRLVNQGLVDEIH